uniref:Biliverdin reductase / flavin reductase n=1 Tax=Rhipicephalus zambeziensis TaxID=60191 RepID=A0A224YIM2_9ACAR
MAPTIKKVAIFGSTGYTGQAVLDYAIKKGYEVTVLVRDASRLPKETTPHHVVVGDVLKKEDVDKAVKGQDGVIVVLGTRNDTSPTTAMSDGLKNILQSMSDLRVKRISVCVSSFLFWERAKVPPKMVPLTEDHERMHEALKACDREWVAIFPPHIADEPARGGYKMVNDAPVGRAISKFDLAEILVNALTMDEHIGHSVGIGYPSA